jgi:hypothetical protein
MKKAKKFFKMIAFVSVLVFFAGPPFLLSQEAKEGKKQEPAINNLTQAKMDAQNKDDQEKAEAQNATTQSQAESQAKAEQQKAESVKAREEAAKYEAVLKTYSLKYISVADFMRSARLYVLDSTGSENALTVRIHRWNIPAFEDLLKKLDVEKRNIQFQVYTIIASKDLPSGDPYENLLKNETKEIENRDLKRVLDEMKGLWNFKHYWLDSPSFLMVKDGSGSNFFKLVSSRDLVMDILHVQVKGDEPGKRIISIGQIQLSQEIMGGGRTKLIDTNDITFKEKGYLVVGVSGFRTSYSGLALILVINAEIK